MIEQTNNDAVAFEVIPTQQNGIRMYIGKGTGNQLNRVTTVDHYDPHMEPTDERQGYQRPPERSRITQIGKFLIQADGGAIFPTSVLLGARSPELRPHPRRDRGPRDRAAADHRRPAPPRWHQVRGRGEGCDSRR